VEVGLTERLEAMVRERNAFDKARRRALARFRTGLNLQWTPPMSRDEIHEHRVVNPLRTAERTPGQARYIRLLIPREELPDLE
jgi:hypothetical protein